MLLLSWNFNFKKSCFSFYMYKLKILFLVSLRKEKKIRLESFIFQLPLMSLGMALRNKQTRERKFPDYGAWGAIHVIAKETT